MSLVAPDRASYEAATAILDLDAEPPRGLLIHTACETDEGVLVTDVWEDQASIDTFFEQRLGKAIAETGMDVGPPTLHTTFNLFPR
jgi:hypothetical protein